MRWPWFFYLENWSVKSFGFQNILHTCIENWFVVIDRIGWVSIKERLNNFDFILINNGSVNNCDFIEKGISCSWKVGTVKDVTVSVFNCCAAATKRNNSIFFSIWVFFHEHSLFTGQQRKEEGIFLTSLYQFYPLYRHLDISRSITAESSPLHIASSRTWSRNLLFSST